MQKKWEILSSKEIFSHPRITLIEDDVLLPDGTKTTYLKFKDISDSADLVCKREDGKILLTSEYSHPPQQIIFQFPGGAISSDEKAEDGANRELMEEANLKAGKLELLGSYLINNRRSASKMFVFLATELRKQAAEGDIEESIENFWFTEEEINEMIKQGKIIHSYTLAAWSLYNAVKK